MIVDLLDINYHLNNNSPISPNDSFNGLPDSRVITLAS